MDYSKPPKRLLDFSAQPTLRRPEKRHSNSKENKLLVFRLDYSEVPKTVILVQCIAYPAYSSLQLSSSFKTTTGENLTHFHPKHA